MAIGSGGMAGYRTAVLDFPRKILVEKLYEQDSLDELTHSYIQNLYRADSKMQMPLFCLPEPSKTHWISKP